MTMTTMPDKFKILAEFIKDISSETPNVETYLFAKEKIANYNLQIDITSKGIKNNLVEVNTKLSYEDKDKNEKKAYFEIVYASIVKLDEKIKEDKEIEKIILCDVQNKIFHNIEKAFLDLLSNSGYPKIEWTKKPDFFELYKQKSN